MTRRMMTREITSTTIKSAKMEIQEGIPVAIAMPDLIMIGNIKRERAQRIIDKEHGVGITVLEVHPETETYEMPVEKFIENATIKVIEVVEVEENE